MLVAIKENDSNGIDKILRNENSCDDDISSSTHYNKQRISPGSLTALGSMGVERMRRQNSLYGKQPTTKSGIDGLKTVTNTHAMTKQHKT